jgi:hypothetical protein
LIKNQNMDLEKLYLRICYFNGRKSTIYSVKTVAVTLLSLIFFGKSEGQNQINSSINSREAQLYEFIPVERSAVEIGIGIGIGSISLLEPEKAEVNTYQTFRFCYVAGKAGMKPGGGIRIGLRHQLLWSAFQTEEPAADGFVSAHLSANRTLTVRIPQKGVFNDFFLPYFPWQNMMEIKVPEPGLLPGDTLFVTIGDKTKGSRGILIQPIDEFPCVFKCYVDVSGENQYLPIRDNPSVNIVASEPYRMNVVIPSDAVKGEPTWALVRVEDKFGNPAVNYRGTVSLSSSEPRSFKKIRHTFKTSDKGVHRFENIVFLTEGIFTLSAGDGKFSTRSNPVQVHRHNPSLKTFWGDIHGHTIFSDGRGTVEQYYDFAREVAGLDFCAVTDHGFQMTDEMWEYSKKITNQVNQSGRFVTLQAYEWSGERDVGGDHNIYFIDDNPKIYRSRSYYNYHNYQMYHGTDPQVNHIEDLFKVLNRDYEKGTVICIPHWGGRAANLEWHDEGLQRAIEVFSEHRRSENWMKEFLSRGYRLGIMASSDNHFGKPGYGYLKANYPVDWDTKEIGMALIGVQAEELTRESIFRAIYNRQIYATSGERIILDFKINNCFMGSEIQTEKPPHINIQVAGTYNIEKIEVIRNNNEIHTFYPNNPNAKIEWEDASFIIGESYYYYVRVVQSNGEEAISSPIWVN